MCFKRIQFSKWCSVVSVLSIILPHIFVATTIKPTIVYVSNAYICTGNSSEFVWLSGMCRRKKDRLKIVRWMYVVVYVCVWNNNSKRTSTCERAFLIAYTYAYKCLFACLNIHLYECTRASVFVSTKMKNGHEHSPIWIVIREIRLGIPSKPTEASVQKMTLLYRVQKHINKTGRWWYASRL